MKLRLVLGFPLPLALALAAAGPAGAQDARREIKVGVVDLGVVIDGYKKAAELQAALKAEDEKLKKELDDLRKQINEISRELEMLNAGTEAFAIREEERKVAVARWELKDERRKALRRKRFEDANLQLLDDIEGVVRDYGEEHGFTLIFKVEGKANDEMRLLTAGLKGVLYFSREVDITADIVKMLNRRYDLNGGKSTTLPTGTTPPAPPSAPPAPVGAPALKAPAPPAKAPGK